MEKPPPSSQNEPSSPPADLQGRHCPFSVVVSGPQRPFTDVTGMKRLSVPGSLGNNSDKGSLIASQQRRLMNADPRNSCRTPLPSVISKKVDSINTWPIAQDRCKSSLLHERNSKQLEPAYHERLLPNNAYRQRSQDSKSRLSLDRRLLPHAESKRTDCHATTLTNFTEKLERLAAEHSRPRLYSSRPRSSLKSGHRSFVTNEDEALFANDSGRLEEDLTMLDVKLENQFERLLSAIDGVTKQVQTAFEGLHERVDGLQASLEARHDSGWKKLKDHLDQVGTPDNNGLKIKGARFARSAGSLGSLEEATEVTREDIRHLTGMLIVEKDADLMLARDFQDRQAMLLKMMQPYLKKPAFEHFWHMKHGLEHCVASVLFKTSNVLARTQSVMGTGSGSKFATEDNDETHFKRFCRKGQKGLEAIADWEEDKWSAQLKKEFLNACKGVWHLQSMVVASMMSHQVEFVRPEAGAKFDEATMDPLDCLSQDHFQPIVQFTIFPGLMIEGSVLIKSQVYLQPRYSVVNIGC